MNIEEMIENNNKDTSYKKTYVVELASSPAVILYIDYYQYEDTGEKFFNGRIYVNGYANFDIEIALPSMVLESLVEAFTTIKKKIDEDRVGCNPRIQHLEDVARKAAKEAVDETLANGHTVVGMVDGVWCKRYIVDGVEKTEEV